MKNKQWMGIAVTLGLLGMMAAPRFFKAQTAHGILVSWTASTPGTYPVAGYNVWWAPCPAGVCGAFTQYNSSIITGLSVSIPSSAVTVNTEYGFYVQGQDTQGSLSAPSAPMTGQTAASALTTTPSTWPTNPGSPGGCTAKIQ